MPRYSNMSQKDLLTELGNFSYRLKQLKNETSTVKSEMEAIVKVIEDRFHIPLFPDKETGEVKE